MKKLLVFALALLLLQQGFCQLRNVNKLTLESTYTQTEIHKSLRDLVDANEKSSYFDDAFFNGMLKKIVIDKRFAEKEKVFLFYLMQKKLGFGFFGVAYLPPKQNYYECQAGKMLTYDKTAADFKELHYNVRALLTLVDSNLQKDVLVASNALLLATLLNPDSCVKALERYSEFETITHSKHPDIFNHYVCLSASLIQSPVVVEHLLQNLDRFEKAEYKEDVLCAIYSKTHSFSKIKDYILSEKNPNNDLSIQTALCVLAAKVPQATYEKSLKSFISESKDKWKTELMRKILKNEFTSDYRLSNAELIVTKIWPGVTASVYSEGVLISDGSLLEFDPN